VLASWLSGSARHQMLLLKFCDELSHVGFDE
jgi:hypothetical protein